jgi:hypothetical protein
MISNDRVLPLTVKPMLSPTALPVVSAMLALSTTPERFGSLVHASPEIKSSFRILGLAVLKPSAYRPGGPTVPFQKPWDKKVG